MLSFIHPVGTAAHVIEGATRIKVLVEETREYGASLVVADSKMDIALLKIAGSGLVWLALGDSDALALYQEIRLLGYPQQQAGFGLILGRGFFLGRRKTTAVELLQLQVDPFDHGHSGGPILNAKGEIVGVAVGSYVVAEKLFPDLKDSPVIVREHKLAVAVNSAKKLIPSYVLPTTPSPVRPPTVPTPPPPSAAMALVRAGAFQMGDPFNEGEADERPVRTVILSAFYIERFEVTKALWDEVAAWAQANGYDIRPSDGSGNGPAHPVTNVSWYEAVKWCNARSEKEGRTPAYYTDSTRRTVYRTGKIDVQNDWVRWDTGYRLPTEAEWEKAARGELVGARYPWGNDVDCTKANYWGRSGGCVGTTTPVGSYPPNGYGLYDMAGNVWEWCWDWYGSELPGGVDPRGPASGSSRAVRGGSWLSFADLCRVAFRDFYWPAGEGYHLGFRLVLPPGP